MNAIVETRVRDFLKQDMHYDLNEAGTITYVIRQVARVAGYDVDERFAAASLAAGPEGRVASAIVSRALGGGGCDTSMYTIRIHTDHWLRTTGLKEAVA
jgi:hypothetical protein